VTSAAGGRASLPFWRKLLGEVSHSPTCGNSALICWLREGKAGIGAGMIVGLNFWKEPFDLPPGLRIERCREVEQKPPLVA
jgi:hypothetical protein